MTGNMYQAFGPELVAQHRTQFELQAQHASLVRTLRRARKVDRAAAAARAAAVERTARRPARAHCSADLG